MRLKCSRNSGTLIKENPNFTFHNKHNSTSVAQQNLINADSIKYEIINQDSTILRIHYILFAVFTLLTLKQIFMQSLEDENI
jgi:hypothetical protein